MTTRMFCDFKECGASVDYDNPTGWASIRLAFEAKTIFNGACCPRHREGAETAIRAMLQNIVKLERPAPAPLTISTMEEAAARAAHEANRAHCISIGDDSQVSWDDAPDWQKSSARLGVQGVIAGNGPRESHASWLAEKERTGWRFGETKDPEAKTHPCFVPYEELPPSQKAKDRIFVGVVRAMLGLDREGAAEVLALAAQGRDEEASS